MNILVINCGSSSLKYQLIDMSNETVLAKGLCERIGIANSFLKHTPKGKDSVQIDVALPDHNTAIAEVVKVLTDKEHGVIASLSDIGAVGHRIVHGGEKFSASVIIDEQVMKVVQQCVALAPLHNPPNIIGIEACRKAMPGIQQVAVFDTAFHQTMPKESYMYALPYEYYEKYAVRKYGFHGTSHKYVSARCAELMGKPLADTKIITVHIGNGGSVTAVKGGKSIDTSMGFTPLDGVVMGTRSGIVDPAAVLYIMEKENLTCKEMNNLLNKKSGLLGISGVSSDMRDVVNAAQEGNERAQLALDIFDHRVKAFIGQYTAIMDGVDAIVFTAGIGENDGAVRGRICRGLTYLGIHLNEEANKQRGGEVEITTPDSKTKVYVISTNEELAIARETLALVK